MVILLQDSKIRKIKETSKKHDVAYSGAMRSNAELLDHTNKLVKLNKAQVEMTDLLHQALIAKSTCCNVVKLTPKEKEAA